MISEIRPMNWVGLNTAPDQSNESTLWETGRVLSTSSRVTSVDEVSSESNFDDGLSSKAPTSYMYK